MISPMALAAAMRVTSARERSWDDSMASAVAPWRWRFFGATPIAGRGVSPKIGKPPNVNIYIYVWLYRNYTCIDSIDVDVHHHPLRGGGGGGGPTLISFHFSACSVATLQQQWWRSGAAPAAQQQRRSGSGSGGAAAVVQQRRQK